MNVIERILHRPFFIKLLHWEYWSFNTVYMPIMFIWVWLSIRARSFFFFAASNPSIYNGGFLMESKWAIYQLMPAYSFPKTIFIKKGSSIAAIAALISRSDLKYPLIGKPDIGGKGRGVRKLNNEKEVAKYADDAVLDFIIQEFVPYKNEVGIFYYRYPGETQGRISGIVGKEFLTVTGDGYSTLRELCGKEKRFILQIDQLEKLYGEKLTAVLPAGAVQELVPYGNHARGAKFLDHSHLNDPALEASIDKVCQDIAGFFYGRLDVRYDDWEQLKQGQAFSIIELNGAGSEPTHIYDPAHSLFFAWKEIVRHWFILWKISRMNHNKGVPYLSVKEGLHMLRENKAFEKKLASQHV